MAKKIKDRNKVIKRGRSKGFKNASRKKQVLERHQIELRKLINAPRVAHQKFEKLFYDQFHDLEYQRLYMADALKSSLISKTVNVYKFQNWIRCVSYQYSNEPLSSRGSVNSIGGRFNIGSDINDDHFTAFNALYIAEDYLTSMFEKFGVKNEGDLENSLELCFSKIESFVHVTVEGELHNVLDLDDHRSLTGFVKILSKVKISHEILQRRKSQGLKGGETISNVSELLKSIYDEDWRYSPQVLDLPSNPQIFGQLAYRSGIEAILYTSVKNKKKCLAIFPKNLGEKSFVRISGAYPATIFKPTLNHESKYDLL